MMVPRRRPDFGSDHLVDIEAGGQVEPLATTSKPWSTQLRQFVVNRWWLIALALLASYGASKFATTVVDAFHWAENHVDGDSKTHMALFVAISMIFHTGVPIPVVMQAWALAIGAFFRWKAFILLFISFGIGIPMAFKIGRRMAAWGGKKLEA